MPRIRFLCKSGQDFVTFCGHGDGGGGRDGWREEKRRGLSLRVLYRRKEKNFDGPPGVAL